MRNKTLHVLFLGIAAGVMLSGAATSAQAGGCLAYYWCGPGHPNANLSGADQTPYGHPPLPTDRQYWSPRNYGHWHQWGYPRVRGYSQNPVYVPYMYGQEPAATGTGS